MNISNVASKYGTRMEEERFNGEVLLKKSIAQGEKVLSILGNGKGEDVESYGKIKTEDVESYEK